jgi:hypothetical protein
MFVAIACIAVITAIAVNLLSEPPEINWRSFSLSSVTRDTAQGKTVLVLVEGHAGGNHQYAVASAQIDDNLEFRRLVHKSDLIPYRINCLWQRVEWEEFGAFMGVSHQSPPFLMLIRKNDLKIVELDPNASARRVLDEVHKAYLPTNEDTNL